MCQAASTVDGNAKDADVAQNQMDGFCGEVRRHLCASVVHAGCLRTCSCCAQVRIYNDTGTGACMERLARGNVVCAAVSLSRHDVACAQFRPTI